MLLNLRAYQHDDSRRRHEGDEMDLEALALPACNSSHTVQGRSVRETSVTGDTLLFPDAGSHNDPHRPQASAMGSDETSANSLASGSGSDLEDDLGLEDNFEQNDGCG